MSFEELIWVDKEFADRYKSITEGIEQKKIQDRALEDYIKTVSDQSKEDFKANLESLEEDVAVYTGLMLKVKQAFEKAKNESLLASYTLWENYDEEKSKIKVKINNIIDVLLPLEKKLESINELIRKIDTWDIDKLVKSISNLDCLSNKSLEMFKFLINNFNKEV